MNTNKGNYINIYTNHSPQAKLVRAFLPLPTAFQSGFIAAARISFVCSDWRDGSTHCTSTPAHVPCVASASEYCPSPALWAILKRFVIHGDSLSPYGVPGIVWYLFFGFVVSDPHPSAASAALPEPISWGGSGWDCSTTPAVKLAV